MTEIVISDDSQEIKSSLEQEIDELQIAFEVRETRYSRYPTSDRSTVVDILHSLSQISVAALKEDCLENRRYATHGKLINQIGTDRRSGQPKLEELELRPPTFVSTFNDLEVSDLELTLCKRILEIDDSYRWHNVRLCFDYFINEQAKHMVDLLNDEVTVPTSDLPTPQAGSAPLELRSEDPQPSTSRAPLPKESQTTSSLSSSHVSRSEATPKQNPSTSKSNGRATIPTPATVRLPKPPANGNTPLPSLAAKRTSEAILSKKRPPKPPPPPPPPPADDDSDCEIVFETTKAK